MKYSFSQSGPLSDVRRAAHAENDKIGGASDMVDILVARGGMMRLIQEIDDQRRAAQKAGWDGEPGTKGEPLISASLETTVVTSVTS